MRYYKIEIDERIWNYLKTQAEPFLDTPNSVLHRLLFQSQHRNDNKNKLQNNAGQNIHKDIDSSSDRTSTNSNTDNVLSLKKTNLLEPLDNIQTSNNKIKSSDSEFLTSLKASNISQALSQILEVLYEIKINNLTRKDATQIVAQRRGTSPFTVMDKYCRQLNKKSREIDELLLKAEGMKEIQTLLNDKFPKHIKLINDFFQRLL